MDLNEEKEQKILKELEGLTPYITELQEFKRNGLFVSPEAAKAQDAPIINTNGKRIDSGAKRKSNASKRRELNRKAALLRILQINKWLDTQLSELLPRWVINLIRRYPQTRPFLLRLFLTKIQITHNPRPVPFGSDRVTIICFWAVYSEVNFVWEK